MSAADKPSRQDARLAVANGLAKEGAFDQAILQLRALLAGDLESEIALGMLAPIHSGIGMHARAIDEYRRVLDINPENALARFQLGPAQLMSESPEEALETWEPLLQDDSEFMAHFHSDLALLQLGRPDEARRLLEIARGRLPESHPLHPAVVRLLER